MNAGHRVAEAAEALAGTPFRLQGREPETGLDCVGLVRCALLAAGFAAEAPTGYRLRNTDIGTMTGFAAKSGLRAASGPILPGDVLLVKPGPAQHHLYVALGQRRFAHAHAGLRRVAFHRGPIPGEIVRHWRVQLQE